MAFGNVAKSDPVQARRAGAQTSTATTLPAKGTPKTVLGVIKAEVLFVPHYDAKGNQVTAMYFKVGDQLYAARDTIDWCASLRPPLPWIEAEVRKRLEDAAVAAEFVPPATDAVDVLEPDGQTEPEVSMGDVDP